MARLSTRPTGTVTFLFTDIEGSTRMWDEEPDAMTGALARHDEIMQSVVERHSGFIFKHTGDGVCAVFQNPTDALEAGLAVQASFRTEAFESIGRMAVRVAIHTGESEEQHGDYRGPALNRVSRLLDVAVGGDILLTDAAEEMIRATLPPDVELADLGEHRLRDISEPGHVYYVQLPGRERSGRPVAPWLAAVAATVVVAGAIAIFSLASPPGTGTPETTVQEDPPTTVAASQSTTVPVEEPSPKWVVDPGGAVITLAAHEDVVITASQSTGLHAYSITSAANVWADQGLIVDADRPLIEPFGAPVFGTPVVGDGSVVYSTLLGTLHAVDLKTGELRWWHRFERCLGGECTPVVPSPPAVHGDVALVAAGSDIYRFSVSTGEFERVDGGFGAISAGPTFGGDFVYVAEGRSVFQYRASDLAFRQNLFVGDDLPVGYQADVISLVTPDMPSEFAVGSDHAVFIKDAEGFLTRRSPTTGSIHPSWVDETGSPIPIEIVTEPAVGPGLGDRTVPLLWSVNSTGFLLGIDAESGRIVRNHHVGPTTHSAVVGGNGTVYVATDILELVGYDPTGDLELFRIPLAAAPGAEPVETGGVVVVAGVDGTVRAYTAGGEVEIGSVPPGPPTIDGAVDGVTWSSAGDLAFVHGGDVWVLTEGSREAVNLTRMTGGGSEPAWSPDAGRLAYISGSVGRDVFLMRLDGSERRNLTATRNADESTPAWSPDGSRIIFSSRACADQGGQQPERVCLSISNLSSVDLAGQIRPLIGVPAVIASDREPEWSPGGIQIAFASDRSVDTLPAGTRWHLWTMSVTGGDLGPVIAEEGPVQGRSPAFSPDGKRLAFISGGGRAGVEALFVVDLETGITTRLADLPIGAGAPSWSPDGNRLAFAWDRSALGRIYTVSAAID